MNLNQLWQEMAKAPDRFGVAEGAPFTAAFFARAIARPPSAWRNLRHPIVYHLLFWESGRIPPAYLKEMNCGSLDDMDWYEILRMNPMMMKHPLCPIDWDDESWDELISINPGCAKYRESQEPPVDVSFPAGYAELERNYTDLAIRLRGIGAPPEVVPDTYDGYLRLASSRAWEKMCPILANALGKMHVDSFQRVQMDGGYADHAFSTAKIALLVQAYKGIDRLPAQCHELALLAEALASNEPGGRAIPAVFFGETQGVPSLPDGIVPLAPHDFGKIMRWFRPAS